MRLRIAHWRQLKCVIIVRISQTHKYNDLQLSKLLATNEINRVPSEFEIIWSGRWWEEERLFDLQGTRFIGLTQLSGGGGLNVVI